MSELEVGNQNQVVNDYDSIIGNNTGAYDKALQDLSTGKTPSVDGGGDNFNIITEGIMAKTGLFGVMAAASEGGLFGGGGSAAENSAFFGGGGKARTKSEVARQRRLQMALTNSSPISGKLTRQQNLALWKELRQEMSGNAPKNKGPFQSGGDMSFTGEAQSQKKKRFPTKADLSNTHVLRQFGLHKIAERISDANRARNNRTLFEDIMGADMNREDAKASLKMQPKDEVARIAETTMTSEKRDSLLQDVLSAEKYFWHRLNQDTSVEATRVRAEIEEKVSPGSHPELKEDQDALQKQTQANLQPAAPSTASTSLEPPKPKWAPSSDDGKSGKSDRST